MLCANIKQIEKHDYLAERFKKGYDFLKNTDLMSLPVGRVDIDGDDVFASVQEYITLPEAECGAFLKALEALGLAAARVGSVTEKQEAGAEILVCGRR